MIKLSPKGAKFCPGCPAKELKLNAIPQSVMSTEKKVDTKVTTLSLKPEKKNKFGLF